MSSLYLSTNGIDAHAYASLNGDYSEVSQGASLHLQKQGPGLSIEMMVPVFLVGFQQASI